MSDENKEVWFSNLPEAVQWIEHHEWTVENYWESMIRVRASWIRAQNNLTNGDINTIQNLGNIAIAKLIPGRQSEFEATYFTSNANKIPLRDAMIALEFIQYFIRENPEHSGFAWDIDWFERIALQDESDYIPNMNLVLSSEQYSDEQKLPIILKALSLPGADVALVATAVRKGSPKLREPIALAAALAFEKAVDFNTRATLYEYMRPQKKFSLKLTAKDYLTDALPEAIPVWDTIVSLDAPFEQAWHLVKQQFKTSVSVDVPTDLGSLNV